MASLSNVKIGRKIALVLGGNLVLLAVLCAVALWGLRATEALSADSVDRLTKARLAETIAGESAAIGQNKLKMMDARKATDDILSVINGLRRNRRDALADFRARANTPEDIRHGTEIAELVEASEASTNKVIASLRANRYADAVQEYRASSSNNSALRARAKEALLWQQQLVAWNEKTRKTTSSAVWIGLIGGFVAVAAGSISGGVALTRGIANPLTIVVDHLGGIAGGDLSKDAPAELQARADEIGTLARAKQTMIVSLRKMIQEISGGIQQLSSSSTELMATSTEMTSGSRVASDKAHSVSAAAEQMSANITSVAAGMEQTTTNLAHVASSTEQMTSTIGEIAQNSEKARRITDEATRQAASITEQINQLGEAAREIGKVTETITEISSQTNLLALNATIEAARAGSAGKGFAVVATEIKALAQQTAAATEDIKGRIAGVQSATAGGITEIGKVSQVIQDVSAIVASIAAAIEEQATATKDIAGHIAEASAGVNDSNTRVLETSQASREIAKDIVGVDHAAGEMATGSDRVRASAGSLSSVAEALRATVSRFQAGAREREIV